MLSDYRGSDIAGIVNDNNLFLSHIASSTIYHILHNSVYHTPHIQLHKCFANLLLVHKFRHDNDSDAFYVKGNHLQR